MLDASIALTLQSFLYRILQSVIVLTIIYRNAERIDVRAGL